MAPTNAAVPAMARTRIMAGELARRDHPRHRPPATGDEKLLALAGSMQESSGMGGESFGADDFEIGGSGADGARTRDLRHAMAALFQLSYSPVELILGGEVYRRPLIVPRWLQPEQYLVSAVELPH